MPEDLQVLIPSRSRADKCRVLRELPSAVLRGAAMVVPRDQAVAYEPLARQHGITVWACPVDGIAAVRQWAVQQSAMPKVLMLDDDIGFLKRKQPDDWRLGICRGDDVLPLMQMVSEYLDRWAHVAVSAREGQHTHPYPHYEVGRPLRALAYRREEFLACEHGRVQVMEDFDVTLQLLRAGHSNCIITAYAQGQGQTQAPGGCSDYRTAALQEAAARRLAELHPGCVRLRKIDGRQSALGDRWDVTIGWQKARFGVRTPEAAANVQGLFDE